MAEFAGNVAMDVAGMYDGSIGAGGPEIGITILCQKPRKIWGSLASVDFQETLVGQTWPVITFKT